MACCKCCTPKCLVIYHITTAILGIIAGLVSFFFFTFYYHNYHAGSWGLAAGLVAMVNLHINLLHKNNKLHTFHSEKSLMATCFIGLGLTVGALIAMICYIVIAVNEHSHPTPDSYWMGTSQSFLVFKYAFTMAYCSFKYSRNLQQEYTLVE